jgi:murein L,D-transpeptidase YafK
MKSKHAVPCLRWKASTFYLFFSFLLIYLSIPSLLSAAKPQGETTHGLVPAGLLKWPEKGSEYAIIVDKSSQKVFVYKKGNPFEPVRTFNCSTGEHEGPKSVKGDRKTPEGIYFFTHTIEKKDLDPIYGSLAIPLDYPNFADRREGKSGYGIWFHGTNKPLKPHDTSGCIALQNGDIDALASYITLNDTPAIIYSTMKMEDLGEVEKEAHALTSLIERWRKAWEEKEIDTYSSFYSSKFNGGHKDWAEWREYKRRLAKQYRSIDVEVENLRILRNGGLLVATFKQKYTADGFHSVGDKTLYLEKNSDEWKIVGETFRAPTITRLAAVQKRAVSSPLERPLSITEQINAFLASWKKAWEKKQLDQYISFYDPGFSSQEMNLKMWKYHKKRLNMKYSAIEVDISDVEIEQTSDHTATVTFKQTYKTGKYRDVGLKNLLLVKKNKHWKIKEEEWRPLNREDEP